MNTKLLVAIGAMLVLVLFVGCIQVNEGQSGGYSTGGGGAQPTQLQPQPQPQCVEHCTTDRQVTGNIVHERTTCTCGGRTCITDYQKVGLTIEQERTVCYGEV